MSLTVVSAFCVVVAYVVGGLGGTTGSASDSRSEGRGFDSH